MSVYYNENDPKTVEWLRCLVTEGRLPAGEVDERSIADVGAQDLRDHRGAAHFFSGIGGWPLALRLAGVPDDAPVWTGSCPCQPFSTAGRRRGAADDRHLWPEWRRLIAECRPSAIFGEQVASPAGRTWLASVQADLEALGYAVGAADLCAAGVGAPHLRQRLFFVAYTAETRRRWSGLSGKEEFSEKEPEESRRHRSSCRLGDTGGEGSGRDARAVSGEEAEGHRRGEAARALAYEPEPSGAVDGWDDVNWIPCGDGKLRPAEPGTEPVAYGIPARLVKLRGYGNAIVPALAAEFIRASFEAIEEVIG